MTRVKRGLSAYKRHKFILTANKGLRGSHSKLFRIANQKFIRGLSLSYKNRLRKKRNIRLLWITRINNATRFIGINYSELIYMLQINSIIINRKILSQLSILDFFSFYKIVTCLDPRPQD
jgi:large subunit ribosomal protein L20